MDESTSGKPTAVGLNTRPTTGIKASKQKNIPEVEPAPNVVSPTKKKIKPSSLKDVFETLTAGASQEINALFSKFAQVLNDRAVADTARMEELDGILVEARDLEAYLRDRKKQLRQTLTGISDKLG